MDSPHSRAAASAPSISVPVPGSAVQHPHDVLLGRFSFEPFRFLSLPRILMRAGAVVSKRSWLSLHGTGGARKWRAGCRTSGPTCRAGWCSSSFSPCPKIAIRVENDDDD
jgi:hypothetical protein